MHSIARFAYLCNPLLSHHHHGVCVVCVCVRLFMRACVCTDTLLFYRCCLTPPRLSHLPLQLFFHPTTTKMLGNFKIFTIALLMRTVMKRTFNVIQVGVCVCVVCCGPLRVYKLSNSISSQDP